MINGHGGNIYEMAERLGCRLDEIIDMSSNLNPLGPPDGLIRHLKDNMDSIISLPEVDAKGIRSLLAARYGVPSECVLAGNGTTQFIYSIPRALETKKALIVGPTYADYQDACIMQNAAYSYYISDETDEFQPDMTRLREAVREVDTVFICNPNNPTGAMIPFDTLKELCAGFPETYFIIDESYLPFAADSYHESAICFKLPNVIVLNSMSKVFRIPGLRVGFLIAPIAIMYRFMKLVLPWSVNALAQSAVGYILENREKISNFLDTTRQFVKNEKQVFVERLDHITAIKLFPGSVYYVLAKLQGGVKATHLCAGAAEDKILIRNCSNFMGLSESYVRFSLKDRETNMLLADKISALLQS